jgi:hypothetical protein
VRAIAVLFGVCSLYLGSIGLLMLVSRGSVSMAAGAPLLFGLELAGPYMFLLTSVVGAAVAWGLFRLNNLARRAAVLIAIAGVVMLVPPVSGAVVVMQPRALAIAGLGIVVRVVVAWYLYQAHIAEEFTAPRPN